MKDFRLWVLIFLILISLALLIYPKFIKTGGVIVTSVVENSACKNVINVGSIITEIAGRSIKDSSDFLEAARNLKGPITMVIDNNPRSCTIPENLTLDLSVSNVGEEGLRYGVDIGGGTIFLFGLENNTAELQGIVKTLNSRAEHFNLINSKIEVKDKHIQILTDTEEEKYIAFLTGLGALEGEMEQRVELVEGKGELIFNERAYEMELKDNKVLINDSEYGINQEFTLDQVNFRVENITTNMTILSTIIFDENDLNPMEETQVGFKPSRIMKQGSGYVFVVSVLLSENGGTNFAKATRGQEVIINPSTGESFLRDPLVISIDGEYVVDLPLSGMDVGIEKSDLIIWGYELTLEDANSRRLKLLSTIDSKRLPVKLIQLEIDTLPTDEFFMNLPLYATVIVFIVSSLFFFARHRKRGVLVLPLILMILGVFVLVWGVISTPWLIILLFLFGFVFSLIKGEVREWVGWLAVLLMLVMTTVIAMGFKYVLDAPTIIGLITTLVFNMTILSFMGDGILIKKIHSSSEYKRYLQKIWMLAAIVVIILIPLFIISELFRGFVIATFVGVLVCTTMTIPIYSDMVRKSSE